jgi:hypothetical protein
MSPNDWYGGSFNLTIKNGESIDEHSSDVDLGILGSGTHRVRLTKTGNTLTFAVDANSRAGPFVADFSTSKSISADLAFLDTSNSRLFFGTQGASTTFDDLSIELNPPTCEADSPRRARDLLHMFRVADRRLSAARREVDDAARRLHLSLECRNQVDAAFQDAQQSLSGLH